MSNVGEAASLFGSAESDSDIFGTVAWDEGSGSNHGTPAPAANGDMHVNPDVDALFGASSANGSLDQASWLSSDPHQNYDHNSSYSGLGDSHQQQSGLHDQWNTYDQSGMQAQEPYYGGQNYSNPPEAHQPYQPPAQQSYAAHNYASSVQTQNTYAPAISQTSNSYYNTPSSNDPYKPEPTPSSDYTPVAATASSTYDPYKPQDPPRAVPQSHSTYSYPSSDRGQTTSSTAAYKAPPVRSVVPPAPPEVTTAPYRPKVLNAYDPPLPPPKPKRFSGQPAFQGQSAYSSYALPKPTNVNVPPPASPAPPRSSSSSHFSSPNDAVLPPPPPARKFATPPAQHLPDGDGSHDYLQVNGYQYHSTLNDEVGQPEKPQHVATSPPSASRRDSTFGSNDYSQVSAAFGSTDQEFLEDPEGGNMDIPAADETPSLESDSSETLNSSWSTGTGTVTPRTAGEIDYEPSPTPSASLHTAENPDYEQSSPEEPTSIASPSAPETTPYDPYRPNGSKANAPPSHQETRSFYGHQTSLRTSSPVPVSSQVSHHETKQPLQDPFAPGNNKPVQAYDPYSPSSRMRSASNGSVLSSHTDPYGPSSHVRQQSNGSSEFGHYTSRYNYPDRPSSTASDRQGIQSATVSIPAYPSYAPSPSLLGTNDPLGRANVRIPVLSFGFGGKVVTCFHGASVLNTGFDVALSSRQSRDIHIRLLTNIVPQSALEESTASYPGPLFSEPGQLVGLVRPGASTQTKTKKAKVVKYLEERIEELSRVVAYTSSGQSEYGRAEGKLILVKLLKIMVENDSRLSGSPEIDASIRETLIPRLADSTDNVAERFSAPVDGLGGIVIGTEASLTVHSLKPSHLDRIQNLLLRGERRQAYHYALDEKLWAHAMVIASSLGKESWQEVANEFIRTELNIKEAKDDKGRNAELKRGVSSLPNGPSSGRESLRVAYSLYAGQGAAAVQALLPANSLVKMGEGLRIPPPAPSNLITSVSSSVPGTIPMPNIPPDVLSKWTETAAMMISSPMSPDTSSALTALGDQLASNQWIEAAHACYLLSPQTSLLGGVGTPSTRIVLLGSGSPHIATSFSKDSDAIIFSEIAEFALSLATPPKGQDHFCGLQYLQPYRLIRAHNLAEMGYVQLATRYCEAITSSLSRGSPYFSTTFFDQLTGLTDRLIAAPSLDKTGSWMGGKMTRPSLDKIGNWLEGRLTKFIAGEGDGSPIQEEHPFKARQSQGPFSHYSSISSAMHSADPSPHASTTNLVSVAGSQPPPARSGSAMDMRSLTGSPHLQINRSSSAMDHVRPHDRRSPVQRIVSAHVPATGGLYQNSTFGRPNGYGSTYGERSGLTTLENSPTTLGELNDKYGESGQGGSPWWGSAYEDGSNSRTPTNSAFMHIPENATDSSSGFMSLMDDAPVVPVPSSTYSNNTPALKEVEEDEEDLGLGNNKRSKQPTPTSDENGPAPSQRQEVSQGTSQDTIEAESKPTAAASSWLSKWWKKDSAPGPIKANLGEETAFYYDKDLKRWVNKKAGGEPPKSAAPPPPPNRSQTASPGRSGAYTSPGLPSGPPPPARPASAVDLSSPPRKSAPRARSNLVPDDSMSAPPTPATGAFLGSAQPPPRPRSGASKKPMRSRYVDVFQQPPTPTGTS